MTDSINKHTTVLVPLEVWSFSSPCLAKAKKHVDLGLLAESLIYYDQVLFNINTVEEFEELLEWFSSQGKLDLFFSLLRERTLRPFYYHFMTSAINNQGTFSIWNINTPQENNQSDFIRLIVYRSNLAKFMNSRKRALLYKIIEENLINETAEGYDPPVENSRLALKQTERINLLTQAYVDHIFKNFQPGIKPPEIHSTILNSESDQFTINYNYDFKKLDELLGLPGYFRGEMPAIGEAHSNKLIWTSSKYGWDLYLGDVMSTVVGNKLFEVDQSTNKPQKVISKLTEKVEYPNIRELVNQGIIDIDLVMKVRSHSSKFRKWLQQESERDRDEIVAYHQEVTKTSGITKFTSSTLKLFGNLLQYGPPFYAAIDPTPLTGVIVAGANIGGSFAKSIGETIGKDWKPLVFGDWVIKEVSKKK